MLFKQKQSYPREYPIMQRPGTEPTDGQRAQIDRRFGMFIHFGINTFHNTDWSDGSLPTGSYRPTSIDAEGWVRTAYEAGMNYVIITAKHHDGFCLWNTDTTDYCIKNSPNTTDVVAAVARACEKYGISLGIYYSLWDRHEKCYRSKRAYTQYMERHLTELMDGRYGAVAELWLDGGWDKPCRAWQLDRLYSLVKTMQPDCQIGVNLTIGKFNRRKGNPGNRYLPQNQKAGDPIRMFPSDFRLWDPHMCSENDSKLFVFRGETYYMPFEQTICSRKEGKWFYSDTYEEGALIDIEETARNYEILIRNSNLMVINMPPNREGQLVPADRENLLRLSERLGIRRESSAD